MSNSTDARISPAILKWARERLALNIEKAAEDMEVTTASLKSWEEGRGYPTIDELFIISEIYNLPVSMFYLSELPRLPLLQQDKKAKKAFEYLKIKGFTPTDYYDEWKGER